MDNSLRKSKHRRAGEGSNMGSRDRHREVGSESAVNRRTAELSHHGLETAQSPTPGVEPIKVPLSSRSHSFSGCSTDLE